MANLQEHFKVDYKKILPNINSITYLGLNDKLPETDRGDDGFGSTGIAN